MMTAATAQACWTGLVCVCVCVSVCVCVCVCVRVCLQTGEPARARDLFDLRVEGGDGILNIV